MGKVCVCVCVWGGADDIHRQTDNLLTPSFLHKPKNNATALFRDFLHFATINLRLLPVKTIGFTGSGPGLGQHLIQRREDPQALCTDRTGRLGPHATWAQSWSVQHRPEPGAGGPVDFKGSEVRQTVLILNVDITFGIFKQNNFSSTVIRKFIGIRPTGT